MSLRISQGITGLDDTLAADEFLSNPHGDLNFTTARLNLSRTQKLFDSGTLLTLKGVGQLSSSAVPVPEAFTYGGSLYGRGFRSVHILGDEGYAASAELSHQVKLGLFNNSSTVTPFVWYDYGNTQIKRGPLLNHTASTYGIGLRSRFLGINLEAGLGIPSSNTLEPDNTGIDHSIAYFNTGWRF
jgi:hemolysin activation/secretion protein